MIDRLVQLITQNSFVMQNYFLLRQNQAYQYQRSCAELHQMVRVFDDYAGVNQRMCEEQRVSDTFRKVSKEMTEALALMLEIKLKLGSDNVTNLHSHYLLTARIRVMLDGGSDGPVLPICLDQKSRQNL
jgi:deoxyadenosine/deoxycytidine kinase